MTDTKPSFDPQAVEEMNRKAIENQFFTPDRVYVDLSLFKDIPIGVVYADHVHREVDESVFKTIQLDIISQITDYQKRYYDTVDPFFSSLGYDDTQIEHLLTLLPHDLIFMMSPATHFLQMIVRHTIRNQNNSAPAHKFTKKKIDQEHYILEPIPVTYYINTYPLSLSTKLLERLAPELGEALGVNIQFICRDPYLFNSKDWFDWMKDIDCFYLDSLGRMTRSQFIRDKQSELAFAGVYFFARKRFEKCVMQEMKNLDFEHQIQLATAQLDMMCDFAWLPNNDVRLTDNIEPSKEEEIPSPDTGTQEL